MTPSFFILWLVLGFLLGGLLLLFARRGGKRRELNILAAGLVLAALAYLLFALLWSPGRWVGIEVAGIGAYGFLAWLGRKHSHYWLALGWALHPLWDLTLHHWGPGRHLVPAWYAVTCLSFDLLVAAYLLRRR